ncbi:hypothetical protein INR49_021834 [Caranx melampygus]|nr:hypothetical protein INR49_021834 [Caranx melampygus]
MPSSPSTCPRLHRRLQAALVQPLKPLAAFLVPLLCGCGLYYNLFIFACLCVCLCVWVCGQVTVPKRKHKSDKPKSPESGCSSPEPDRQDSSGSERHKSKHNSRLRKKGADLSELQSAIESIKQTQEDINRFQSGEELSEGTSLNFYISALTRSGASTGAKELSDHCPSFSSGDPVPRDDTVSGVSAEDTPYSEVVCSTCVISVRLHNSDFKQWRLKGQPQNDSTLLLLQPGQEVQPFRGEAMIHHHPIITITQNREELESWLQTSCFPATSSLHIITTPSTMAALSLCLLSMSFIDPLICLQESVEV